MGFVSDESESEAETSFLPTCEPADDEESQPPSDRSPLFPARHGSLTANGKTHKTLTRTTKDDSLLNQTRLHRTALTEADEILGELEENESSTPLSPFSCRRSSARSTPSRLRPYGAIENDNPDPVVNETTALLARSSTGRSYRERRRRRSMPMGEVGGSERREREAQNALGGWWKMRWWRGEGNGNGKAGDSRGAGA